ncbi:MAG TPA: glycosyltransferase [Bacteroidetes bacterium]|nr:glycosyltransferase [Bacteroidota bacterium]
MRILYLLQEFPFPPINGIRLKTFNVLTYMAKRHECYLLCFGSRKDLLEGIDWVDRLPNLKVLGVFPRATGLDWIGKVITNIVMGYPPSLARFRNKGFGKALTDVLEKYHFDVVHFDLLNVAQYRKLVSGIPTLLSANDSVSLRYWRSAESTRNVFARARLNFSARRIAQFETKMYPKFDAVHFVSQEDAADLLARTGNCNVVVIPICVEPEYLQYPIRCKKNGGFRIFTSGNFGNPGLLDMVIKFVSTSFAEIKKVLPSVELIIVGRNTSPYVKRFLSTCPGVSLLDWVEDYISVLASADIAVFLDNTGTGMKNRVLQALAMGKPVIGTRIAFNGIQIQEGVHAFVCEDPSNLSNLILELLKNEDKRFQVGTAARRLVKEKYSRDVIGQKWEALYLSLAKLSGGDDV